VQITNTSRYPTSDIRYLVHFALQSVGRNEVGKRVRVRVTNKMYRAFGGRAMGRRYVIVRVGAPESFPFKRNRDGWPKYEMRDWRECVVAVAAHEFNHLSQFERQARTYRHVKLSEVECEHAAKQAVEEFRADIEKHVACMDDRVKRAADRYEKTREKRREAKSPQGKLARLEEILKRWQRKEKLAKTKIRGIKRRMKYYQRRIDASRG